MISPAASRRGRPPTGHNQGKQLTVKVPAGTVHALDEAATLTGVPRWQIVDAALRAFVPGFVRYAAPAPVR